SVTALCTNRDLPLRMPVGVGKTDLILDAAAPLTGVRVLKGPSPPASSLRQGNISWQFINHLSLNYLSLSDDNAQDGAAALREMLELYAIGVGRGRFNPLVRRFPQPGRLSFGRGLEVELGFDELAFEGASPFLFGAVMEQF